MARKHMKKCSTPLVAREIQIKTTMSYNFIATRRAIIKTITSVGENMDKLEHTLLVEM